MTAVIDAVVLGLFEFSLRVSQTTVHCVRVSDVIVVEIVIEIGQRSIKAAMRTKRVWVPDNVIGSVWHMGAIARIEGSRVTIGGGETM